MNQPMSAAEFWWNHLTPEQQEFIKNHPSWQGVHPFSINVSYLGAIRWPLQIGWPETPQSTFSGV